jgi:hypothetical protein
MGITQVLRYLHFTAVVLHGYSNFKQQGDRFMHYTIYGSQETEQQWTSPIYAFFLI